MKRFAILPVLSKLSAVVCFAAVVVAPAMAQHARSAKTPEHELLKKDVGTWDAAIKIWPAPDAEPMESKATEKNELFGDGMWLIGHFDGEIAEMPFKGLSTTGYDPVEKKYVGTWVDSMTPYLTIVKGDYDKDAKTMTATAQGRDMESGEMVTSKHVSKHVDDDTRMFEIYMPGKDGGEEWRVMEIQYKRRSE